MSEARLQVQFEATAEATHLFLRELNGSELESYYLQLKTYVKAGRPLGKSHILIKRRPHPLWIDVYVSEKLATLFPLMYHFLRPGEPTWAYARQLELYLSQIRAREQEA